MNNFYYERDLLKAHSDGTNNTSSVKDKNLIKSANFRPELEILFDVPNILTLLLFSLLSTAESALCEKLTKIFLKDHSFDKNTENTENSEIYVIQRNLLINKVEEFPPPSNLTIL